MQHITAVTSRLDMVAVVREVLRRGMSINLHMFHGGTTFGFMTGAVAKPSYKALIPSYGLSSFHIALSDKKVLFFPSSRIQTRYKQRHCSFKRSLKNQRSYDCLTHKWGHERKSSSPRSQLPQHGWHKQAILLKFLLEYNLTSPDQE